jgi:hypothetical protein
LLSFLIAFALFRLLALFCSFTFVIPSLHSGFAGDVEL